MSLNMEWYEEFSVLQYKDRAILSFSSMTKEVLDLGTPPFEAFCQFPEQTLIVGKEVSVDVTHCDTDFCFEHPVNYNVAEEQFANLLEVSTTCSQSVTLNCFSSPIKVSFGFEFRFFSLSLTYSSVPNRRACTFINFERKIPPARSYFGLHDYWFWDKGPPCTSIPSCTFNGIGVWILWDTLEYFGIALGLGWQCFGIHWNTLEMLWNTSVRFRDPFQSCIYNWKTSCPKKSPLHGLILVCTFIDFEKIFTPARLFCPARLMFLKNFSTCTFISACTSIRYTRVPTYVY